MDRRAALFAEISPAIWVHLIAALIALVLGAMVLWRRKGDARHKLMGRIWFLAMFVTAVSSFWITQLRDGFSPIHLLSVYTLISLGTAIWAIRWQQPRSKGRATHANTLKSLYISGMLIAGGFTFLPDRLLGKLTFGEVWPMLNYAFVGLLALVGIVLLVRLPRA